MPPLVFVVGAELSLEHPADTRNSVLAQIKIRVTGLAL